NGAGSSRPPGDGLARATVSRLLSTRRAARVGGRGTLAALPYGAALHILLRAAWLHTDAGLHDVIRVRVSLPRAAAADAVGPTVGVRDGADDGLSDRDRCR